MATPINMSEPVRLAEVVPASLRGLRDDLRAELGVSSVWDIGDQLHDFGFHRSRAWILGSGFSRYGSGDYSVKGELNQGGDSNWVAAIDFALPDNRLAEIYGRLDPALAAGQLPQVRELIKEPGHGHLSFYRSMANDDHSNVLAVITGQTPPATAPIEEDDDMRPGLILEDASSIVLMNFHPETGEPFITNIKDGVLVSSFQALGWQHRKVANVGIYRTLKEINDEYLAAMTIEAGTPADGVAPHRHALTLNGSVGTVTPA